MFAGTDLPAIGTTEMVLVVKVITIVLSMAGMVVGTIVDPNMTESESHVIDF